MKKAGPIGQKTLRTIHLFFVSLWVGGAMSLFLMMAFLTGI